MVNYTLTKYSGDPSKVFALGSSSGAMMTNLLAGAYPDVFAGGASFSGIPYACMEGSPSSSRGSGDHSCPDGKVQKTGQQWVDRVHQGYPGYNGTYPKMALFHGTADTLVTYQCLIEQVKQWTAMNNVSFTRNVTNTPSSGFTESIYGDGTKVLAFTQAGGGHVTPFQEETVLKFFSLI
jgi:acetylxylan esterase